jgi:hypothetical protein
MTWAGRGEPARRRRGPAEWLSRVDSTVSAAILRHQGVVGLLWTFCSVGLSRREGLQPRGCGGQGEETVEGVG